MRELKTNILLPIVKTTPHLTKPEERFFLFVKQLEAQQVTEEKIIEYWKKNVADPRMQLCTWDSEYRDGAWYPILRELEEREIRYRALTWFDRWLGRFVRTNLIIELRILK